MTQPGETDNYSASDHIKAIFDHMIKSGANPCKPLVDAILINNQLPNNLAKKYEEKDSLPVEVDTGEIKKLGLELVTSKLIEDNKRRTCTPFSRSSCKEHLLLVQKEVKETDKNPKRA